MAEVPLLASSNARGFTVVELAVALAIIGVVAAVAVDTMGRARPRAELAGVATELHAVVHRARQEALARGRDVAVLVYPAATTPRGVGRIVVVADGSGKFMSGGGPAGALDYCSTKPDLYPDPLEIVDLPPGLAFATPPRTATFPFPYNLVPAPAGGCSFCSGTIPGGGARGAVRFNARGRASFFADCGSPSDLPSGGSFAVTSGELGGSRVLTVLVTGDVRTFSVE